MTTVHERIYIDDFCEDLNYQGIILYIGNVPKTKLRKRLNDDYINKDYRFDYIINAKDPSMKDFMYIENCDLQDLSYPVHEYVVDEGYSVHSLCYDQLENKFYIVNKYR